MAEREYLSVRELVKDAGFDLRLLTGDVGLERVVKGIHLSDYDDPTPWMASGSVLITTGAPFAGSPSAAVRYLDTIVSKDTVALGVGVGQHGHLEHICPEMAARARELRIPIFEIPESVPFRAMFAYVYHALASSDMHRLRRALSVQGQLLDLLVEDKGIGEVLAWLSGILEMSVLLFDARGELVASAGTEGLQDGEARDIWRIYEEADDLGPLNVLEAADGRFHIREIRIHGSVERVLAAVVHHPPTSEFAEIALSFVQRLISLDLLRESEQIALRHRMRALLLDDLLLRSEVDHVLRERLSDQGVDLGRPWRICVFSGLDGAPGNGDKADEKEAYELKARVSAMVETFLRKHRLQVISMVKSDVVVTLCVFDGMDAGAVHSLLVDLRKHLGEQVASPNMSIGVSATSRGDAGPAAAYRQAAEAARTAANGARSSDGVVLFDEAGRGLGLLAGQSEDALAALTERLITPLVEHDRIHLTSLLRTVRLFIESRLSAHDTAATLGIHRNTLGKRLSRVEGLLHIDLARMEDVLELYVALRAAEFLEGGPPE